MNNHAAVLDRYSKGAERSQQALCCPVDYDHDLTALKPIAGQRQNQGHAVIYKGPYSSQTSCC